MINTSQLLSSGIHPQRVAVISEYDGSAKGGYVLYWMQASVRTVSNAALEYAVLTANALRLPLVVCFVVTDGYPNANSRHYRFLYEGIADAAQSLEKRGITFLVRKGQVPEVIIKLAQKAAYLVTDCGCLRTQTLWRQEVYNKINTAAAEIEDNTAVPVEVVSDKAEYGARTIRPKINRLLEQFLGCVKTITPAVSNQTGFLSTDKLEIGKIFKSVKCEQIPQAKDFKGGQQEAQKKLDAFLSKGLGSYAARNDPNADAASRLSPYLHFGMISPVHIALKAKEAGGAEDFLEQLIVRRELAINYVHYTPGYDEYESAVPNWAKSTLADKLADKRQYLYNIDDFEKAKTHDDAWNAAQKQMVNNGYMAGYMRMYWGKKVIEWSQTPKQAFETLVYLNDKYELDGRDANGYCGIAWCFGRHDRPWASRAIFGTVRYMNYAGLKRKFDVDKYCRDNLSGG